MVAWTGSRWHNAFHGARGYIGKPNEKPSPIVPWPYARIGTLLGKIDDGVAFPIEDELCFVVDAGGELMLSMNDVLDEFDDNRGTLRVRITTEWDRDASASRFDTPRLDKSGLALSEVVARWHAGQPGHLSKSVSEMCAMKTLCEWNPPAKKLH